MHSSEARKIGGGGWGGRRLSVDPDLIARATALTRRDRPGTVAIPDYVGRPGMVIISDSHGSVETYLRLYEALPGSIRFGIDLGDKIDRGPNPLGMNYLLQTLRVRRVLGNHDAMWVAAGLGVPSQATELVRWLLRYNEIDFLTSDLGVNLRPLREYADKYFPEGAHRVEVKSAVSRSMEAAATYLKIIAEAAVRFPEHAGTALNDSDLRVRKALFFKEAVNDLTAAERDIFGRLTSGPPLDGRDTEYFYRLMGRLRTLDEEEQRIVDHLAQEFLNNYAFYQFVRWMSGDGDLYITFRHRQGYPCDFLATHAAIPVDEAGELAPFNGRYGREAMIDLKDRIQLGLEAWRQLLKHDNSALLEMHRDGIDVIGMLPCDRRSPLYARQMQTAARAVLPRSSDLWDEPEEPFFTHFETVADAEMVRKARANIARSFSITDPRRFVIVHGHKPTEDGMFKVLAGGTVINIDGGMAQEYGGRGGAIVIGSTGAAWLSYPDLKFSRVPLPLAA